jgi:hypothetical protein
LEPSRGSEEFVQWHNTMLRRVEYLLPKDPVVSKLSALKFSPSENQLLNAALSGRSVDPEARFREDMRHAVALMRSVIEEIEFLEISGDGLTPSEK